MRVDHLTIPPAALALVKAAEGCRLEAYRCPAGKWTIGYGHTGPLVRQGLKWTQEQAEEWLLKDLLKAADDVHSLATAPLTPNQTGALASFVFNLGAGCLKRSTLLMKLNARDYQSAAEEFDKWVYATVLNPDGTSSKRQLGGLVKRRTAERILFLMS